MARRTEDYRPDAPTVPELAGGVVIFREPDGQVLLLHEAQEDRWCLPKGHVDPGESIAAAALREVQEETGFAHVDLGPELHEINYRFYDPKRALNVHKTVVYFRGRTADRVPQLERFFDRAEWVDLSEAVGRVKFPADRSVLEAAQGSGAHRGADRASKE
ncbi:MAG: NUDIX hydrolase [Thermoplasmata archaeon]